MPESSAPRSVTHPCSPGYLSVPDAAAISSATRILPPFAIEHGATLGTFDRDFERFAGLRFDWLQDDAVHDG